MYPLTKCISFLSLQKCNTSKERVVVYSFVHYINISIHDLTEVTAIMNSLRLSNYSLLLCILLLIFAFVIPAQIFAAPPELTTSYWIADKKYESPEHIPTVSFTPIHNNSVGLSFYSNDIWLKIPLNQSYEGKTLLLDCTYFKEVTYYTTQKSGGYDSISYKWNSSTYCSKNSTLYPYFVLADSLSENDTAYIRISSIYSRCERAFSHSCFCT